MNPQGNDYFGAEAVASFNGFPVLRNVIQKYDAKDAKHTLTAAFLGYRAKEDITALPPNFLVQPSQNVLHLASGLIYSRPGYTLDGQAATTSKQLGVSVCQSHGPSVMASFDEPEHDEQMGWQRILQICGILEHDGIITGIVIRERGREYL